MPVSDPTESPVDLAKRFVGNHQPLLAVEVLEPWLQEYPEDARAWSALAAARYELRNFSGARIAAAKAVEIHPQSARNWCNYGMILRKQRDFYEAERALHRALVLDASYDRARTELRKVYEARTGSHSLTDDDYV